MGEERLRLVERTRDLHITWIRRANFSSLEQVKTFLNTLCFPFKFLLFHPGLIVGEGEVTLHVLVGSAPSCNQTESCSKAYPRSLSLKKLRFKIVGTTSIKTPPPGHVTQAGADGRQEALHMTPVTPATGRLNLPVAGVTGSSHPPTHRWRSTRGGVAPW